MSMLYEIGACLHIQTLANFAFSPERRYMGGNPVQMLYINRTNLTRTVPEHMTATHMHKNHDETFLYTLQIIATLFTH